jgi:hypothetical protein
MIRVGTRINVRPHARKKQVWGKVVLERVVVILFVSVASGQSVEILFVFKSPFWTKKIQKCGILPFEKSPFSLYKQNK